jgi:hypothetical protein
MNKLINGFIYFVCSAIFATFLMYMLELPVSLGERMMAAVIEQDKLFLTMLKGFNLISFVIITKKKKKNIITAEPFSTSACG